MDFKALITIENIIFTGDSEKAAGDPK